MNCKYFFAFIWAAIVLFAAADFNQTQAQTPSTPAPATVREVTDEYFGTRVTDPYRWMEEPQSKELAEWMKAQNDFTRSVLDPLPEREKFLRALEAQNSAATIVSGVQRVHNRYFYFKLAPGDVDRKLFVREGLNGEERLLVDPQQISGAAGKRFSIISCSPSPDAKFVSFLIASGGGELGEIRVVEAATGKLTGDRIDLTRWEAGAWLPDASGLLYIRFGKPDEKAPPTERLQKSKVYLHRIGDAPENDRPVFGFEVNPEIRIDPKLLAFPQIPFDSKNAYIQVNTGVSPNSELYAAPIEELGEQQIPWRKLIDFSDEAKAFAARGDDLYILTYKNAPRYRVVKTSLAAPDLAKAKTIVAAGEAVATGIVAARDALYVQQMNGGNGQILRVEYQTGKAENLKLPYDGAITNLTADPRTSGLIFALDSWVRPKTVFNYDWSYKEITDTKLQPASPIDVSNFEAVQVKVRSHDGVMVPLSLIYKKGLKLDGRNIVGMTGYGAYGFSREPVFMPSFFPFLEAGGVLAIPHVRGGGEYGEEWHLAGFKSTKPNTWKDFISCAEYLIKEKYTSPGLIAGHGASAGGILIGNAIAERPDLFGAAVIQVGLNNMLRYETTANGVPNIPEYGSVKTEQGFKDLLAMDAYHKIKKGVKYPAVLLTHGINDPRVEPWLSAKMAARLQASTASEKPVLLRIDYDAGHGIGNSRRQINEEIADMFAFIFSQLGAKTPDKLPAFDRLPASREMSHSKEAK